MFFFRMSEDAEFFYLAPDDRWFMVVEGDGKNVSVILNCKNVDYPLLTSEELIRDYPGLQHWDVYDYFNEIVHAAFLEVKKGSNGIDFAALQEEILPNYLKQWAEWGVSID